MKLLGLPALALYATSVYAADCFGQGQTSLLSDYFADAYWDARGKMCGNTDCGYQKDCTTTSTKTVSMGLGEPVTVRVSFKRQKLNGNGFEDCWDATENIINQCILGSHQMDGTWATNGQLYQLSSEWN
ncbi:hypothetical protein PCL_05577 [Purpureocillium lilacinum]|uniref:Uncharacterized protein n=1 Tax=Purpureocillium lilacinum TaxID=33203 RepID=A0A2U3DUC8_PURLI|nr:hypothetical protein Purlil1_5535 [Purpureocillium lilacinum]PWI65849.1 hypothetical protein PCL_05577 [Purpureocillium lilacinum]